MLCPRREEGRSDDTEATIRKRMRSTARPRSRCWSTTDSAGFSSASTASARSTRSPGASKRCWLEPQAPRRDRGDGRSRAVINRSALEAVEALLAPGVSTAELNDVAESAILSRAVVAPPSRATTAFPRRCAPPSTRWSSTEFRTRPRFVTAASCRSTSAPSTKGTPPTWRKPTPSVLYPTRSAGAARRDQSVALRRHRSRAGGQPYSVTSRRPSRTLSNPSGFVGRSRVRGSRHRPGVSRGRRTCRTTVVRAPDPALRPGLVLAIEPMVTQRANRRCRYFGRRLDRTDRLTEA